MMDEVGPLGAIEPGDLGNRPPGAEEPVAAPPPADRTQAKTFVADAIAMRAHTGCDDNIEACRRGRRAPPAGGASRNTNPR